VLLVLLLNEVVQVVVVRQLDRPTQRPHLLLVAHQQLSRKRKISGSGALHVSRELEAEHLPRSFSHRFFDVVEVQRPRAQHHVRASVVLDRAQVLGFEEVGPIFFTYNHI